MPEAITFNEALSEGLKARIQRVSRVLTQKEIADVAGVTERDVTLFENNQRLDPTARRKILRTYDLIREPGVPPRRPRPAASLRI